MNYITVNGYFLYVSAMSKCVKILSKQSVIILQKLTRIYKRSQVCLAPGNVLLYNDIY